MVTIKLEVLPVEARVSTKLPVENELNVFQEQEGGKCS